MLKFKEFLSDSFIEESKLLLAYNLYEWLYVKNKFLNEDITDFNSHGNLKNKDEEEDIEDTEKNKLDDKEKEKIIKNPLNKKEKDETKENDIRTKTMKTPIDKTAEDKDKPKTDEEKADAWFKGLAGMMNNKQTNKSFQNYRKTSTVLIGRVYAFKYNPKHKNELRFYDENPLVVPFEFKQTSGGSGFLGINLHFIPRQQRKAVMRYFMEKDKVQVMKQGELKIDYLQDLKLNPKFKYIYYCIRHYLNDHVVGGFYNIPQEDYINVMSLYSAKYIGMTESEIINMIKNMYSKNIITKSPNIQKIQQQKAKSNEKRKAKYELKGINNKKKEFDVLGDIKEKEKITGNI